MRTVLPLTMPPHSGCVVRGCSCRCGSGSGIMVLVASLRVRQGVDAPHVSVAGEVGTTVFPIQRVT